MSPFPDPSLRPAGAPQGAPSSGWLADLHMAGQVFVLLTAMAAAAAMVWTILNQPVAERPAVKGPRRYVQMQSAPDQDDPQLTRLARERLGRDLTDQERKAVHYCWRNQPPHGVGRNSPYYAAILDPDRDGVACERDDR